MWSHGDVKLGIGEDGGKKVVKVTMKAFNQMTGKESHKSLSFGDVNWGPSSWCFLHSLDGFRDSSIDKLMEKAQQLVKSNGQSYGTMTSNTNELDEMGNGPCIHDLSDSDDDCKFILIISLSCTDR
jgi:hypothetical protein